MSDIYVPTSGGLGDVARVYLKDERYWGYLKYLKKRYPESKIKILSRCHTPQVEEFFKYNPYIDEFREFGWIVDGNPLVEKYKNGAIYIDKILKRHPKMKWEQPVLHLGEEDKAVVENIAKNSYGIIVMHPFAIRQALDIEEFHYMADNLIDKYGYTVVYLGGTHNRYHNLRLESKFTLGIDIVEESDYERPGLYNLLNKSNCRVGYRLIELCDGFVGHCSCFNIAAWIHSKRSVVFSPPCQRPLLTSHRTYAWPLIDNLPWCRNYYTDDWGTPRKAAEETIEFFRR